MNKLFNIAFFVAALAVSSCGGLRNPLNNDDVAKLNSSFNFEDKDNRAANIGGPVTIDIPSDILDKLVAVKDKVTDLDVYISNDTAANDFSAAKPTFSVKTTSLVHGLNLLGNIPDGTPYVEGDSLILTVFAGGSNKEKGNPLNTGVVASIVDVSGVASSTSNVVAITSPELQEIQASGINLKNVYFDFDSSEIKAQYQDELKSQFAPYASKTGVVKIQVSGNTDERGTQEYNLALGERRAMAIKRFLVGLGYTAKNIYTVSYGEEKAIDLGHTEEAWSKNRRGEVHVLVGK